MRSANQREADLCREKSPTLVPAWFILIQIRTPNPHNFISPKSTALIDQSEDALIGLVGKDANDDIAAQFCLDIESLCPIDQNKISEIP